MWRILGTTTILILAVVFKPHAQVSSPAPRVIDVDGRPMRVWTAGLERRNVDQPAVVLEAGAGEGLDNWKQVFEPDCEHCSRGRIRPQRDRAERT